MIKTRLDKLRKLLGHHKLSGYIVPTMDEYLSEYPPSHAKRLEYITGFTGSNGLAVIFPEYVLFFTDGRYLTQAKNQLDEKLFKIFDQQLLANFPWHEHIDDEAVIGYDPKLLTNRMLSHFTAINISAVNGNLIDQIWDDKPSKPNSVIYDYPIKYAGKSAADKIDICKKFLSNNKADTLLITDPASICWLLNIRASDVEFSPLLLANTIITKDEIYLFTDKNRVDKKIISSRPYLNILPESRLNQNIENISGLILYDENSCSNYIADLVKTKNVRNIKNPVLLWKACKNDVEIQHIIDAHIQDAVAVCELLAFLEYENIDKLSEYDLGQMLTHLRSKQKNYVMDSFPAICGYRENGAIIHYRAEKDRAKKLSGSGILLVDSGGQYMGATTDITRTVTIGTPKDEHKHFYTKVLKGHIALSMARFPAKNITGGHIDVLARQYLWQEEKDYAHGTGHGVGSFLSVHEGPQNISPMGFGTNLMEGMVVSNEPGYYVPDKYGIRIENMMYVKKVKQTDFLEFATLTLVPYAKALINKDMLVPEELIYLRSYYEQITSKVRPLLSANSKKWLDNEINI